MTTQTKVIVLVIAVAALVVIGLFFGNKIPAFNQSQTTEVGNSSNGNAPQNSPNTTKSYANAVYKYSVSYPSLFNVKEYTPENVTIGYIGGENEFVEAKAEVRVITVNGRAGETFDQGIVRELTKLCAADGVNVTFSCTGLEREESFTTPAGLNGRTVYLKGQLHNISANTTTTVSKGPYMIFVMKTNATNTQALVIHAPLNQTAAEADVKIIESIAQSVQLPK